MTTQNIALFTGLGAKMDFLNQRQRVLSQNIANSDTPGFKPKDLVPVDFNRVLQDVKNEGQASVKRVSIAVTNSQHMPTSEAALDAKARQQKETYEVAPAGNAVIVEEQLINAGQTVMDYNLMTNLYQKNIGMIRTALGRQ